MATRHRLSKHFTIEEFDCKDGTRVPRRDWNGLEYLSRVYLERMRKKYGRCTVHSGYRTRQHNINVHGETNSYHRYDIHDGNDQAVDVSFERGTPADWQRTANWIRRHKRGGRGGIGRYDRSRFVHIDIRDYKADWTG